MYYQENLQIVSTNPENEINTQKKKKSVKSESSNSIQCEICGLVNFNTWSLTMHMRRHNNDRPAKCNYCPASFVNNTELKSHLTTHTKEKNYKCRFCPKRFTNKSSKYLHEDTHGILEHKCKFCPFTFRTQLERRIHQKTHNREDLSCKFCIKKFVNEKFLRIHEQTYHARSLRCLKCKLIFRTQEELQNHKLIHKSGRRSTVSKKSNEVNYFQDADVKLSSYFFTCGICLQKFSFHRDLSRHIEAFHHLEEKESIYRFKCGICHKSFDTKMKLRGHMIGHGPKKHKCPHCSYCSTRGKDLAKHINGKHSNCKLFKCSECGKQFTYYSTFVAHKLKYGEKKFKCDMCDKAFYVKSRLCAHKRVSHYSANSVCELCGKIFKNIRSFRGHLRYFHNRPVPVCLCNNCGITIYANEVMHHKKNCSSANHLIQNQNIKGPPCSLCNVTFSTQRDLLEHFKEFHPSDVFYCSMCSREYLSQELLQKHIDKKHKSNKSVPGKTRKHLLTSDEKKELKRTVDIGFVGMSYECFACGTLFGNELDMNSHLDEIVCLKCKADDIEQNKFEEKQNFKVTKLYENKGCYQILNDFEIEVTPGYINLDPLDVSTSIRIPVNNDLPVNQEHTALNELNPIFEFNPSTNIVFTNGIDLGKSSEDTPLNGESFAIHSLKSENTSSQNILPTNNMQDSEQNVVSTQELLKLLQSKTINVDGTPFISFNELFTHLKYISGVDISSK